MNIQKLMQQAQQMQAKLQKEMQEMVVEATVGGGMVTVKMSGTKQLVAVEIDPEFAMAFAKLSIVHGNIFDNDTARAYAEKSIEHADRLTQRHPDVQKYHEHREHRGSDTGISRQHGRCGIHRRVITIGKPKQETGRSQHQGPRRH